MNSDSCKALLAARLISKVDDDEFEYKLPDDDNGQVITHQSARMVFMAQQADQADLNSAGMSDKGAEISVTGATSHTEGGNGVPPNELYCPYSYDSADESEPSGTSTTSYNRQALAYAPTKGTDNLSNVTCSPISEHGAAESESQMDVLDDSGVSHD